MRRPLRTCAWALLLALPAACSEPALQAPAPASAPASAPELAAAAPASAAVERAVDGDTLVLAGGDRVRLLGVDAPELRDPSPVLRALAEEARAALARRVEGRVVALVVASLPRDRFGRILAYADLDGDVGEELVRSGLARAYVTEHPRLERYLAAEAEARSSGRGAWTEEARRDWGPPVEATIAPAAARDHLGQVVRVEGVIASTRRSPKAVFLALEAGGGSLKVVTFTVAMVPDELLSSWRGRRAAVTGRLKLYRGEPELILERPDHVEILEADAGAVASPVPDR